jgi:hypothetical protein
MQPTFGHFATRSVLLSMLIFAAPVRAQDYDWKAEYKADQAAFNRWMTLSKISGTQPRRKDLPPREENITDEEVRAIEAVMAPILPGALVNIGTVVEGCPCQDGPDCSDQVWVVAHRPDRTVGIMLSRIKGRWVIGPLQAWWLEFEPIRPPMPQPTNGQRSWHALPPYTAQQQAVIGAYPACANERLVLTP